MRDDTYDFLFDCIREHCRGNNWFGPDGDIPPFWGRYEMSYWFGPWDTAPSVDTHGAHFKRMYDPAENASLVVVDRYTDPRRHDFAYPPATERQLRTTEAALGFALPPFLRALYKRVANGGFGPSYGIIGLAGGFPLEDEMGVDLVSAYELSTAGKRLVALRDYEGQLSTQGYLAIPSDAHIKGLLRLAYEGCGITYELHAASGKVFWNLGGAGDGTYCLELKALSLEAWLNVWLDDPRYQLKKDAQKQDWSFNAVAKLVEASEVNQFDPSLPENPIATMGCKVLEAAHRRQPEQLEGEEE
jgi:hypothetical protein